MIASAAVAPAVDVAGNLPYHEINRYIPLPQESHHLFGAAFLFVGVLLVVETLAGHVWHRNRLRTLMWPATIMVLGAGMLAVVALDPDARLIHFTIGLILLAAGWVEYRHRQRELPRGVADLWIVPALIAGGLEIGVFHFHGSLSNSGSVHLLLGLTAGLMAPVRLYQTRLLTSMPRHAFMGVLAIALGLELLAFKH